MRVRRLERLQVGAAVLSGEVGELVLDRLRDQQVIQPIRQLRHAAQGAGTGRGAQGTGD